jgi:ubiquinone/menaquinone biosynthesis C-methylase UbiE
MTVWGANEAARHCHDIAMDKPMRIERSQAAELAAQAWTEVCELLDLQLSPLGLRAIEALSPEPGNVVVDIGCGAGQSVLQLAARVGPEGRVIGLDIAPRLLEVASRRAGALRHVSFLEADAEAVDLPEQSADGLFSRFGVMAFANPTAAFANFRRILKSSGRLAFVCWRSLEQNELDLLPLRAAGLEEMIDPTPFSFAEAPHLRAVLETAGFKQITIEAHDEMVSSGDLDDMAAVLLRVGPLGKILRENPALRATAEPRLRAALVKHDDHQRVSLKAATWIVTA